MRLNSERGLRLVVITVGHSLDQRQIVRFARHFHDVCAAKTRPVRPVRHRGSITVAMTLCGRHFLGLVLVGLDLHAAAAFIALAHPIGVLLPLGGKRIVVVFGLVCVCMAARGDLRLDNGLVL